MSQEKEQFEREGVVYINDELILKFFKVFSRAEYALKNAEFYISNQVKVMPDWKEFAKKIDSNFCKLDEAEINEARKYLFAKPPQKQVIKNSKLNFDNFGIDEGQNKTYQLLSMVQVVRNNLGSSKL